MKALGKAEWRPELPQLWRLIRAALLLILLSVASRELNLGSWASGGVTILWPTNGFLLGILLCSSKRHWPAYITVAYFVDFFINRSLENPFAVCVYLSACNMLEAILPAFLLYPIIAAKPDLTQRKQLVAFLGYGVVLAPALTAMLASFFKDGHAIVPTLGDFCRWFTADALGVATVTPLYLAFKDRRRFSGRSGREILGMFSLLILVTFAVFWQTRFPFLFVLLPILLLLEVRLGLAGSALGLLMVSILGGFLSTAGRGPIALVNTVSLAERDLVFQFFIAVSMLLLYIVEVLVAEGRQLQADLRGSEKRFRLLAEASNDVIFLSDLYGKRSYVSPSVTDVLGWTPQQIVEGTFRELVHPEDSDALRQMFDTYRDQMIPQPPGEFRYLKADGTYTWLEFSPKLFCDPESGEPAGFVNIGRDISLRKREEAEKQRAFADVEHLAISDALTGISNRRHLNTVFEREWLRAIREQSCIALLLLDVDRFKPYNDIYGHPSGDGCLQQVAAAIQPVVSRPADLLARYGGEEFAVVLPGTDAAGAGQIAEWIRFAVECCQLTHVGNPPHGVVTVSVGCAALVPHEGMASAELTRIADQALYRAKSTGRNRVQRAEDAPDPRSLPEEGLSLQSVAAGTVELIAAFPNAIENLIFPTTSAPDALS